MFVIKVFLSELYEKNFDMVFDIQNIVFMGMSIVFGNGVVVVFKIGDKSYFVFIIK